MHKISAEFEIVTPMFLGGADQAEQLTQIRPPSVKGALRFWWRALQWNKVKDLQELHQKEARLFGAAANENDKKLGQSLFSLRVKTKNLDDKPYPKGQDGLTYLLGQGLKGRKPFTGSFSIYLCFKSEVEQEDRQSVAEALMVWGLLGGLGARSRRGWGSVSIQQITGCDLQTPKSIEEVAACVRQLIGKPYNGEPPYTAFSTMSQIDVLSGDTNQAALDLLNDVGIEMLRYRSYGSREDYDDPQSIHMVAGEEAKPNFISDHDDILEAVKNGTLPKHAPKRGVFGFPHNYFFKSIYCEEFRRLTKEEGLNEDEADRKAKRLSRANLSPKIKAQTRRASPLLIHIHKFPDGKVTTLQTLLQANFLPPHNKIAISAQKLKGHNSIKFTPKWSVIHNYLNRFSSKQTIWPAQ